jgi:hypothetical protein
MENNQNNNTQSDVLHFESHSKLSAEAIAKAVQRHNREHKSDERKAARHAKAKTRTR